VESLYWYLAELHMRTHGSRCVTNEVFQNLRCTPSPEDSFYHHLEARQIALRIISNLKSRLVALKGEQTAVLECARRNYFSIKQIGDHTSCE
jgi:hypothetical protein